MSTPIKQRIGNNTLVVDNYYDAIEFYTQKLQFKLIEDTDFGGGSQAGDRVFLFLQTNDFWRGYEFMKSQGVEFIEEPRIEEYGTVVVFKDLYGTKWDLLQLDRPTGRISGNSKGCQW